jgi:hypothetical protein
MRPPIAFVGAGASMAYARISWRDAVIAMQDQVLRRAKAAGEPTCEQLLNLLEQVKIDGAAQADPGDYLVTFQLSEQLDKALDAASSRTSGPHPHRSRSFRQRLAELLCDDLGHAQHILDAALGPPYEPDLPWLTLRRPTRTREEADKKALDFRSVEFFKALVANVRLHVSFDNRGLELLQKLEDFTKWPSKEGFLQPYHRFVIGAALRVAPRDCRPYCLDAKYSRHDNTWDCAPYLLRRFDDEANELPPQRDPLRLLRDCEITRFLTTNYDHEIDRRLKLEGLTEEHASVPPDRTEDPLAQHWRTLVFDRHHVGQMLAFAARDGRHLVEVAHLHGRADAPQDLVVTNEDYQKHYLSIDDQRAGMDDALSAAFGGNAILFVGSGMGEDDLLRPLRQFVGDNVPGSRRVAIAIVPADKRGGDRATDLEKLRNLQRYGVYTIHTGNAGFGDDPKQKDGAPKLPEGVPKRWLSRLAELRRRLDDALNPARSASVESSCLAVTRWIILAFGGQFDLDPPSTLEGVRAEDHSGLDLRHEMALFIEAIGIVCARQNLMHLHMQPEDTPADALRYALEGCMDSIVGAFLCARLIRMKQDEAAYTREWLQPPLPEDPVQAVRKTLGVPGKKKTPAQKNWNSRAALWARHGVAHGAQPLLADAKPGPPDSPGSPDEAVSSKDPNPTRRFYTGAPSQTFNHLLRCLNAKIGHTTLQTPPPGRRLFVFIARRGVGKGHFFAALSSAARLE